MVLPDRFYRWPTALQKPSPRLFRHLFQRARLHEEMGGAGEDDSFFGKKLNRTGFINRRPLCLSLTWGSSWIWQRDGPPNLLVSIQASHYNSH